MWSAMSIASLPFLALKIFGPSLGSGVLRVLGVCIFQLLVLGYSGPFLGLGEGEHDDGQPHKRKEAVEEDVELEHVSDALEVQNLHGRGRVHRLESNEEQRVEHTNLIMLSRR